MKLRNLMVQN